MNPQEFENRRLLLYHSLGANFEDGLTKFEQTFLVAESEYRAEEVKALINLISDPHILPNPRLEAWRSYFKARQVFMYWDFEQVEILVAELHQSEKTGERDQVLLGPRIQLLHGQVQALRGNWGEAQKVLANLTTAKGKDSLLPEYLRTEARIGLAQASLSQARSQGGWAEVADNRFAYMASWLFRLLLLPLYLPLIVYLAITGCLSLWRTVWLHAADYSNWYVFQNIFTAYRSLTGLDVTRETDQASAFRTRMLKAAVLADAGNFQAAASEYVALEQLGEVKLNPYRHALVTYGQANLLVLEGHDADSQTLGRCEAAQQVLAARHDERSAARMRLMLAAIDLAHGRPTAGLEKWQTATMSLIRLGDPGTTAEALEILYKAMPGLPKLESLAAERLVADVEPKIFIARLPNRLFQVIQVLGWVTPLLLLAVLVAGLAVFIASGTREDVRQMWQSVFSSSGLMVAALGLLAGMTLNTLLGLVGLASVIFAPPTCRETYRVEKTGLIQSKGVETVTVDWESVAAVTVVARGVFFQRDGALSYCHMRLRGGGQVYLAGATRQFDHLVREVERRRGQPAVWLHLRWYGGLPLVLTGLGAWLSFLLSDGRLFAWLDFPFQARAAASLMMAAYLLFCWVLVNWVNHLMNVAARTCSQIRTAGIGGGLGLALVAGGFFGREPLYPSGLMWVLVGIALMVNAFGLAASRLRLVARIVVSLIMVPLLIGCGWLAAISAFPTLYNIEAYAYSGELSRMAQQAPSDPDPRPAYFSAMGQSARRMLDWDPTYTAAYSFLGYAEFSAGHDSASLAAYTAGIETGGINDLLYCRALVEARLKNNAQATVDYQAYLKIHRAGRRLRCQVLFMDASAPFPLP